MSSKFCCESFLALVDNMGNAGLSVVLKKGYGFVYFCLQSRACTVEDVAELQRYPSEVRVKIRIVEQMGIKYCPSCGADMQKWIECNPQAASEIERTSKDIVLE